MPHDATSLEELELIVDRLSHRENRWGTYQRIAERADVSVPPDEIWMLVQICSQGEGVRLASLADQFSISRDRKSTRLNSSHSCAYRMLSSALQKTQRIQA